MKFIETPVFTRDVQRYLSDDEYRGLQLALLLRPEQGVVMPRSGGLRKVRWRVKNRGKRGGVRVIYYWVTSEESIYLLAVFDKSDQVDLTATQARLLTKLVQDLE